jgi:hypothetical protein
MFVFCLKLCLFFDIFVLKVFNLSKFTWHFQLIIMSFFYCLYTRTVALRFCFRSVSVSVSSVSLVSAETRTAPVAPDESGKVSGQRRTVRRTGIGRPKSKAKGQQQNKNLSKKHYEH